MGKAMSPPFHTGTNDENNLGRLVDFQTEVQSQLFDKTATYNNIVVSIGYAGFISLWIWAREITHPWDAAFTALLLGTSLFFFVLWNVVTTFIISTQNIKLAKVITKHHPTAALKLVELETCEKDLQKVSLKYYATWYFVFVITAITGFLSGGILIVLIAIKLLGLDFGIHTVFAID